MLARYLLAKYQQFRQLWNKMKGYGEVFLTVLLLS